MIADNKHCCGCGACEAVCPVKAVKLCPDSFGFKVAKIDASSCVNCGQCSQVCPGINVGSKASPKRVYAIRAKDLGLRKKAASGGAFTLMAKFVLSQGGVVIGAGWSAQDLRVVHKAIYSFDDIADIQGSKYVQSDMSEAFLFVRKALSEGKYVLFSGTPCQTAAVRNFVRANTEKLFLVSLICYGVPPANILDSYKASIERRTNSRLKEIRFRDKSSEGFKMLYRFDDPSLDYSEPYASSFYIRAFFENLSIRSSCSVCHARDGRSAADIQIGDCWGAETFAPNIADQFGLSVALAFTDKGVSLLENLDCDKEIVDYQRILEKNPMIVQNPKLHKRREEFLRCLCKGEDFISTSKKFLNKSVIKRVLSKIKKLVCVK